MGKKQGIAILILLILLVVAGGYISVTKYREGRALEGYAILQQGAQQGYQQAIVQLFQQATTCQPVPIYVENKTLNLIAVECIQAAQQQEQQAASQTSQPMQQVQTIGQK